MPEFTEHWMPPGLAGHVIDVMAWQRLQALASVASAGPQSRSSIHCLDAETGCDAVVVPPVLVGIVTQLGTPFVTPLRAFPEGQLGKLMGRLLASV